MKKYVTFLLLILGIGLIPTISQATTIKFSHHGQWTRTWYIPFTDTVIGTNQVWHVGITATTIWLPILPLGVDITGLRFEKGPNADAYLTALGNGVDLPAPDPFSGNEVAFDNTMFPDGPGYTTNVGNGSFFDVFFDTPLEPIGMEELDLSPFDIVMSTPLDFQQDPTLINAFLMLSDGSMREADIEFVPEPSTLVIFGLGLLGLNARRWKINSFRLV